ncbi:MAG: FAD-binding oxidoreductase [Candidatus Thorarchaeota archaeon]
MDQSVIQKLEAIVGKEYVSTRNDVLLTYSASASTGYDRVIPALVIRPSNREEVSAILKLANEFGIPITPRSGGSSLQGEVIPKEGGIVIDMLRFTDITLFEDLRSVRVGAGVTYGMLDKYLNGKGLWVPIYPDSSLVCTVAGNVSVNGAGPGSGVHGCMGDLVLGLEVVLPTGEIIQTGSEANPNSPGPFLRYAFGPDISGLFIGALGGLGIITSVSIKTFKRMRHFHYETYGFEDAASAEKFLLESRHNDVNLIMAAIYEGRILEFFLDMLGEEYGVPQTEWPPFTVSATIGRVREDQLTSDIAQAGRICSDLGGMVIGVKELPEGEWEDRMWTFARSSYVHGWWWMMLYHHQTPSNWHRTIEEIWEVMDKYGILGHTAGFLTGNSSYNYYPQLYFDPEDEEEEQRVREAHRELSQRLFKTGAVPFKLAPYWVQGVSEMEQYLEFVRTLKRTIDPNGIMNPGVLGGI